MDWFLAILAVSLGADTGASGRSDGGAQPCQVACGQGAIDARHGTADGGTAAGSAPSGREWKRNPFSPHPGLDSAPPVVEAEPSRVAAPVPTSAAEQSPAVPAEKTQGKATEDKTSKTGSVKRRRRQRTPPAPRSNGLAATRGKVADVDLHGAAPIRPAEQTTAAAERKIGLQDADPSQQPKQPPAPPVQAATIVLDDRIVQEITQRKTMFRMCYESARRRGVVATRADVKWILAANGTVHDVQVEVAQDAQLANCLRVIASRPFPAGLGQDIPVAIPLLFLISR